MFYDKSQNPNSPAQSYASEPADLLEKYLSENTKTGHIKFQVYQNSAIYGRLPIEGARISLCKHIGDDIYVCKIITTDKDGNSDPIAVPTVSAELSQTPGDRIKSAQYDISVEAPGFDKASILNIPVFEGVTSIQSVILNPISQTSPQSQSVPENRGEISGNH